MLAMEQHLMKKLSEILKIGFGDARNFVIFGVDNSLSSQTDNQKKKFSIDFSKSKVMIEFGL